jgi:hypothetical protein
MTTAITAAKIGRVMKNRERRMGPAPCLGRLAPGILIHPFALSLSKGVCRLDRGLRQAQPERKW